MTQYGPRIPSYEGKAVQKLIQVAGFKTAAETWFLMQ